MEGRKSKATWVNDTPENVRTCLNCPLPVCAAGCANQHTGALDPLRKAAKKSALIAESRELARLDWAGKKDTEIRRMMRLTQNQLNTRRKQTYYRQELEQLRAEARKERRT